MSSKLIIGPINKGLRTDREPFIIDNDAFPTLVNAYQWRGRIRKKRGTTLLGRLQRTASSVTVLTLDLSGDGTNSDAYSTYGLSDPSQFVPGTISWSDGTNTYTDADGVITGSPSGSGTIDYVSGAVSISGGAASQALVGTIDYYTNLPVMGLEDYLSSSSPYPSLVAFDTLYAYMYNGTNFYNTSYYRNSSNNSVWSGQDYQQFWSTNYAGAMWVTNGKYGLNFATVTYSSGSPGTAVTFNLKNSGVNITDLSLNDVLWFNQFSSQTGLNGFCGYISDITDAANGNYVVTFDSSITVSGSGIAQLLTYNLSSKDGIRWFDGYSLSPTTTGWMNFAPPLSAYDSSSNPFPYYLIGAKAILPYKDRLLFFGAIVGTTAGTVETLQDTVAYSWNGTPYYTQTTGGSESYTYSATTYRLTPSGEVANVASWYQNQVGYGGYVAAGIPQSIVTVTNNEDVLIVGFTNKQTRLVYTGNDLIPFIFYSINSELGSESTFSGVTLDRGGLTMGAYGLALTDQTSSRRIDLEIPDQIFTIPGSDNGDARVTAIRDYRNEWIYFTYPSNENSYVYPTQTLLYNYRDVSWAIFNENYTTYGTYRYSSGKTWSQLTSVYWNDAGITWGSGSITADYPEVVGGNAQGFVLIKGGSTDGTGEDSSGYIADLTAGTGSSLVYSPNHCLSTGDYIYISGCLGNTSFNDAIWQISFNGVASSDRDNYFYVIGTSTGTYTGGGVFARLVNFFIQTKEFPLAWSDARKVRIGTQRYLLDRTSSGEATVSLYSNQNSTQTINAPPYVGLTDPGSTNTGIIYTNILSTTFNYPSSSISNASLGIDGDGSTTSFSFAIFTLLNITGSISAGTLFISLVPDTSPTVTTFTDQGDGTLTGTGYGSSGTVDYGTGELTLSFSTAPSASAFICSFTYYYNIKGYPPSFGNASAQLWQQQSSSVLGDSVQIGFTMSADQMADYEIATSEFTLHSIVFDVYPGPVIGGGIFG